MQYLFMVLLFITAAFLILLVLIQRGKGGGLAGAFGGMGGQSAFGTKAGDTFTKVTIGVAAVWIVLCILSVRLLSTPENLLKLGGANNGLIPTQSTNSGESAPATPSGTAPATESGTPATGTAPAAESGTPAPSGTAPAADSSVPAEKPAE